MNHGPSRSTARRLRAAEQRSAEHDRRAGRLVVVAAVALPLLTVAALGAAGLGPLPRGADDAAAAQERAAGVVVGEGATPAQRVVESLMREPIPGWTQVGPVLPGAADPLLEGCGAPATSPTITSARRLEAGGRVVGLHIEVYGAGLGAVALRDGLSHQDACGAAVSAPPSPVGLDTALVWRRPADGRPALGSLRWRRGDVVVGLTVVGGASGLASLARGIDQVLVRALDGRCVEIGSSLADAARSPYSPSVDFQGRVELVPVAVPPVPDPGAGTGTLPPAPTPSYPARPADPVEPSALPTPVLPPTMPTDPGPQPTGTAVPSRVPDPAGPGCGWAFVGLTAPSFDAAAEAERAAAAAEQARADLVARQQRWSADRAAAVALYPAYEQQLAAFVRYTDELARVAAIWDAVTAARSDYARLLTEYEAAAARLAQWEGERDAATAAYLAAFNACYATGPSAAPIPSPLPDGPIPSTPGDPVLCPPPVPGILLEAPPTVPASPTPPS